MKERRLSFIIDVAIVVLKAIINLVSPPLRDAIVKSITDGWKKAKDTKNPFDDLGMKLLARIMSVELPE